MGRIGSNCFCSGLEECECLYPHPTPMICHICPRHKHDLKLESSEYRRFMDLSMAIPHGCTVVVSDDEVLALDYFTAFQRFINFETAKATGVLELI